MNIKISKYSDHKDSGVELLGLIPKHWKIIRLKNICEMLVSNVDKHSKAIEKPVKLCNYVDVYKNDFITNEINFMKATASPDEINRFKIKVDDVLITKDSEDWLDIGVPALVKYEENNLICGYHLAILRPKEFMKGGFLHRVFLTPYIKFQLSVEANGVTRYGISQGAISDTFVSIPPLNEQIAIIEFLERKTILIDQAIGIKQKQIELLQERRQILIHNAITRGLNPNVKMKDSGVEWIGEIPEHWEIVHNRILFNERNESGNESLPILSVSIHTAVSSEELNEEDNIQGRIKIEDKSNYKHVRPNDIVFNMMRAWQGAIGAVRIEGMVSPAYVVAKPKRTLNADFLEYQFRTKIYIQEIDRYSKGITDFRKRLYWNEFKQLKTILPPIQEQNEIVNLIETMTQKIETAISLKEKEIDKLKEYKATIINSAVTGKIKVS